MTRQPLDRNRDKTCCLSSSQNQVQRNVVKTAVRRQAGKPWRSSTMHKGPRRACFAIWSSCFQRERHSLAALSSRNGSTDKTWTEWTNLLRVMGQRNLECLHTFLQFRQQDRENRVIRAHKVQILWIDWKLHDIVHSISIIVHSKHNWNRVFWWVKRSFDNNTPSKHSRYLAGFAMHGNRSTIKK